MEGPTHSKRGQRLHVLPRFQMNTIYILYIISATFWVLFLLVASSDPRCFQFYCKWCGPHLVRCFTFCAARVFSRLNSVSFFCNAWARIPIGGRLDGRLGNESRGQQPEVTESHGILIANSSKVIKILQRWDFCSLKSCLLLFLGWFFDPFQWVNLGNALSQTILLGCKVLLSVGFFLIDCTWIQIFDAGKTGLCCIIYTIWITHDLIWIMYYVIPSREVTYHSPSRHFWRWLSFSPGRDMLVLWNNYVP